MNRDVSDEQLCEFADRVKGQTVLITGGAGGIGKEAALLYGKYGANIVIGDINASAAEETVGEIRNNGGQAVCKKCNVLSYDEQLNLFEFALSTYGSLDVVLANAGVGELDPLLDVTVNEKGFPKKPNLKTFEINFFSVTYTTQLAYHYFQTSSKPESLKTLVLVASMVGFTMLQRASMYSSSKHALIAFMRSLHPDFESKGCRIVAACPWFVDTPILPPVTKRVLTGLPLVSVQRVADMLLFAATDTTRDTNGAAYMTPDAGTVFRLASSDFKEERELMKIVSERVEERHRPIVPEFILFGAMCLRLFAVPLGGLFVLGLVGKVALRSF